MGPGVVDFQFRSASIPLRRLTPTSPPWGRWREAPEGYGLSRDRACGTATADFTGPKAESAQ